MKTKVIESVRQSQIRSVTVSDNSILHNLNICYATRIVLVYFVVILKAFAISDSQQDNIGHNILKSVEINFLPISANNVAIVLSHQQVIVPNDNIDIARRSGYGVEVDRNIIIRERKPRVNQQTCWLHFLVGQPVLVRK